MKIVVGRKMKSAKAIVAGFLVIALLACWFVRAHLVLAGVPLLNDKGEEGGQWLRDRLIACGEASVRPCISALRTHSPWVKQYCYLPQVLRHFGEPARAELLRAIDGEPDRQRRACLISALQAGFDDFSRFDRWLADRPPGDFWETRHMAFELRVAFPAAPPLYFSESVRIQDESSQVPLNPEFLAWWQARHPK